MGKMFRRKTKEQQVVDEITLEVDYGGFTKMHSFQVRPQVSGVDLLLMQNAESNEAGAMTAIKNIIRRSTDNSDATVPSDWKPDALPRAYRNARGEIEEVPDDFDELNEEDRQYIEDNLLPRAYRGPDGVIYPFTDAEAMVKWNDPSNHTSRRRWDALLLDDGAAVEIDQLMDVAHYLIELATKRPTRPSR